jgi:hypothetical protein
MFKTHATFRTAESGIAKFRSPVPWRASRLGPKAAHAKAAHAGFHMTVFKLSYQERNGLSGAEHGGVRAGESIRKSNRNSP